MSNPTLYSSFVYFICGCFSFLELGQLHPITITSFILFTTSYIHHSRPYKVHDIVFDYIRVIDMIVTFCIGLLFIYYYTYHYITWVVMSYVLFVYFVILSICNNDFYGCLWHSSFHVISGLSMIYVITQTNI